MLERWPKGRSIKIGRNAVEVDKVGRLASNANTDTCAAVTRVGGDTLQVVRRARGCNRYCRDTRLGTVMECACARAKATHYELICIASAKERTALGRNEVQRLVWVQLLVLTVVVMPVQVQVQVQVQVLVRGEPNKSRSRSCEMRSSQ